MKLLVIALVGLAMPLAAAFAEDGDTPKALSFEMKTLEGKSVKLADYKGKVLLVVNVASRCGLTPQYEALQELHKSYGEKGLVVMGFPCNQFGGQEPGSAQQIREFCSANYNVSFPMFSKVEVNGSNACDLYQFLTSLDAKPAGKGDISWNFEKFLINREGEVVGRFSPRTKPNDPKLLAAIKSELGNK